MTPNIQGHPHRKATPPCVIGSRPYQTEVPLAADITWNNRTERHVMQFTLTLRLTARRIGV